jgi:hypothetical protein
VLFFGGCGTLLVAAGSGDKKASDSGRPTTGATVPSAPSVEVAAEPSSAKAAEVAPPESVVRDGKFEFQVTDIASAKTIGDNPFLETTAQGVFVVFTMQVTNIGNEPQNFFATNQKLIDVNGREYEASSQADMNLNQVANLGQINPGNSVTVKVAFDVPQELQMNALELHDSMISGGSKLLHPSSPNRLGCGLAAA